MGGLVALLLLRILMDGSHLSKVVWRDMDTLISERAAFIAECQDTKTGLREFPPGLNNDYFKSYFGILDKNEVKKSFITVLDSQNSLYSYEGSRRGIRIPQNLQRRMCLMFKDESQLFIDNSVWNEKFPTVTERNVLLTSMKVREPI